MRSLKSFGLIATAALIGMSVPAHASIIGASVDIKAEYPDTSSVILDAGVKTVDGSLEYPSGAFSGYSASMSIDLTGTQILIALNNTSASFLSGGFNGFDILFLTGSISTAVVDGSSGFNPFAISINGQHLLLNYQGVHVSGNLTSIINVTGTGSSSVPEPASFVLFGAGLAGLGLMRRLKIA